MKIMNAVVTLSLVSLVLLLAPRPREAELMKSGQWEIDTTMDGQTYTTSRCATSAELKEMNGGPRAVRAYTEKSVNEWIRGEAYFLSCKRSSNGCLSLSLRN